MPRSPHELPIPIKGNIFLRDGQLIVEREDGQEFGRFIVGEDGLIYNGGEFTLAQKGDPAAINLMSSSDQPMSGKWSGGHMRSDGRYREVVYTSTGRTEDSQPGDMRGQVAIYVSNGQEGQREVAFIATSHGTLGRIWTGLKNFKGWMWKFAVAGDDGPYSTGSGGSGKVTRFYTDGGKFCINWQDDTGSPTGIVYSTNNGSTDETTWVPVGKVKIDPV